MAAGTDTRTDTRTEQRDYYEVLGAEPSASGAELRAAFREAVLRHHPDRSTPVRWPRDAPRSSTVPGASCAIPLRRLHYDRALERGNAETLAWPLEPDEAPSARGRRRRQPSFEAPEPLAPAPVAQRGWLPRPGGGLHGRPERAARLDRRQPHHRRGLARALRAVLAALRGDLLPRPWPHRRLDRGDGAAGRAGPDLRDAGPRRPARGVCQHRHVPARDRLPATVG